MAKNRLLRIGLAALVLVAAGAALTVPALAEAGTGMVAGHYRHADGQPVTTGTAYLFDPSFLYVASDEFDADGAYQLSDVAPGEYRLMFYDSSEDRRQFYDGKLAFQDATPVNVAADTTTTIDETTLPAGTASGRVLKADGSPAPFVDVMFESLTTNFTTQTYTDGDGRWVLHPFADDYRVGFRAYDNVANTAILYAPGQVSSNAAATYSVVPDQAITIDQRLLPLGAIEGTVTEADGSPYPNANVRLYDLNDNFVAYRQTGADGKYRYELAFATQYKISFSSPDDMRTQWAHAKTSAGQADAITVTEGFPTVVDEQLLPLGAVRLRAKDAGTGAALANFCTYDFHDQIVCSNGTGQILVPDLPPGARTIYVFTEDGRYYPNTFDLTVPAGQTLDFTAALVRGASISTTVRDRATGAPVPNVCVSLVALDQPNSLGNAPQGCSNANGVLAIGPIDPDSYHLFADAQDGVHGDQWVGSSGGVGRMAAGRIVTAKAGLNVSIPPILMDRAGRMTGVVTDAATGEPLPFASVSYASYSASFGGGGPGTQADEQGRYTLTDLGPYDWVLFYTAYQHAAQYTGGVGNRLLATGVKVRSGQTTTYNVAMAIGTAVTGTVRGPNGQPVEFARLIAYNAVTGDEIYTADTNENGVYTARVLAPQGVKLNYYATVGEQSYTAYYRDSPDLKHATVVLVGTGNPVTVNISATRPAS